MGTWILRRSFSFMVLVLALGWPGLVRAQNAAPEVRVATFVVPPFVMQNADQLAGFSIDLWEEIAARLKVKASYTIAPDPNSFFQLVQSKNVDIGVSAVFFTAERDKIVDFTYPILNSGLQVMVRDSGKSARLRPLRDWLTLLFSQSALLWLAAALIVMVIPAHVVWLLDRRNEDGVSPTKNYFPGIFHSMLWAGTALASQVQVMPRQWFARAFGLLWMFAGVVFVALYTAQLTALLTVEEIRGAINGPGDLPGKRVGTLAGSNPAIYLRKIKADVQETASTDEMYQALLDGKVDAVLFASASLRYFATHAGQGQVRLVGPEFDRNDAGFVVQLESPLRKRVNSQLLALHEDGTYRRIHAKWFGDE
jgi:polar amino acid transport system substrate-binding protein